MFTGLISFLGGSAFRMVWGELSSYFQKKQDHAHELAMQTLQSQIEAQRHERDLARLRLQSDLGVKEVQVAGDVAIGKMEVEAWLQAVRDVGKTTGIAFIDKWNGSIRPLLATLAILVIVGEVIVLGFALTDFHKEIVAAIIGIYIADRSLMKRGK